MKSIIAPAMAITLAACTNYSSSTPVDVGSGSGGGDFGTAGSSPTQDFGTAGTGGASSSGFAGGRFNSTFTEPVVVARSTPPPLAGGTLLVTAHGHSALVADPDHDLLFVVDLDRPQLHATVPLQPGDEPGRSVEDKAGRVHVALRSGGAILTVDPEGTILDRRSVCTYPRGIAYDGTKDALHVACAGGELVTLPAGGGNATRTLQLDPDLRDVVVDGDRLLVSRFRAAELVVVEADGKVSDTIKLAGASAKSAAGTRTFEAGVAWRTVAAPGGGALMVFQDEQTSPVEISAGGYGGTGGGECGLGNSIVQSSVAIVHADGVQWTQRNIQAVLPLDVAIDPSGERVVVASAGASPRNLTGQPTTVETGAPTAASASGCSFSGPPSPAPAVTPPGRVVAVGYDWQRRVVLQTREPSAIVVGERALMFSLESAKDTGHDLFHFATGGGIACASCHPEGREDGHVWTFAAIGPRRTQTVGGGIMDTKPFHWDGDMTDFNVLAHEVFTSRMSGPELGATHLAVMEDWIDRIPAWKSIPARDAASAEHGKQLFNDAQVACASCHAGAKLTNNATADVGTKPAGEIGRGKFQVPSLRGLRWRAPFMHQGCAGKLADRFNGECGGGDQHGHTSQLSDGDRNDLANYLGTL